MPSDHVCRTEITLQVLCFRVAPHLQAFGSCLLVLLVCGQITILQSGSSHSMTPRQRCVDLFPASQVRASFFPLQSPLFTVIAQCTCNFPCSSNSLSVKSCSKFPSGQPSQSCITKVVGLAIFFDMMFAGGDRSDVIETKLPLGVH